MNQDDFKKVLNEALEPIKTDIKDLKVGVQALRGDVQNLEGSVQILKENVQELTDVQENRLLPSVIETETTVKSYADAYKTNKANIERLDNRVAKLEDKAGIISPSEFTIQR